MCTQEHVGPISFTPIGWNVFGPFDERRCITRKRACVLWLEARKGHSVNKPNVPHPEDELHHCH
jgi:hypothetical protein